MPNLLRPSPNIRSNKSNCKKAIGTSLNANTYSSNDSADEIRYVINENSISLKTITTKMITKKYNGFLMTLFGINNKYKENRKTKSNAAVMDDTNGNKKTDKTKNNPDNLKL